jgi:hypothetical protein
MFNVGNARVYAILKNESDILNCGKNCANGNLKRKLKKAANEDIN